MAQATQAGAGATIAVAVVASLLVGGGIGYALNGGMNSGESMNKNANNNSSSMASGNDGVTVGGAKMVRTKDIVDNAAAASNVKTVVSLVQKAGLVETLKSEGPLTVFAPNDSAFKKIDMATLESLQKEENVGQLKNILTLHVVAGTYTTADLRAMAGKGETLTSVQGQILTPVVQDNAVAIKDPMGSMVTIETPDVISSNGVTHVITSVLMPTN
ncbi:MAG TPA: fasciclin domain-containing protein [Candidatus Saccharimonadales bacterium]|jgi:uncharacterized surface protein with fasciclin (FAS1) repeats